MVLLLELPEELIDKIVGLNDPKVSITLSSVCRLFNAIATPHAYRHVSLRGLPPKIMTSRTLPLLRTVIDRPTVGAYVRVLTADFSESCYWAGGVRIPSEFRKFALHAASRRLSREIVDALWSGSFGAMLFLLICQLPSLQTLDINAWKGISDLFFRQIHFTPALPSGFQSLHSIIFSDTRRVTLDMIMPFLGLANITTVHCVNTFIEQPEQPGADGVSERTENRRIEVIHLEDCVIHPESLAALVESCRGLKSFIYRHDPEYPDVQFSAGRFMDVIRHTQDTLENLELDFAFDRLQFIGSPGPLDPLCDFVALKHISASIPLLLAEPWQGPGLATVLPPSLTSLTLWIANDSQGQGWEGVVVQLLENKKEAVPLLKKLCVEFCFDYIEDEMIQAAGIQAEVEVTFFSDDIMDMDGPVVIPFPDDIFDDEFSDDSWI